jgi:hypothetical protein
MEAAKTSETSVNFYQTTRLNISKNSSLFNSMADITETGRECLYWIHLIQDKVWQRAPVNTVVNLRVPYTSKSDNLLTDRLSGS